MRDSISLQVPPHDVMILKVRAKKRYPLIYLTTKDLTTKEKNKRNAKQ